MMTRCYFCCRPIKGRTGNKHHVMPRRYFKRGEDCHKNNVAMSHIKCHRLWHDRFDRPELSAYDYRFYMLSLKWGAGIFAEG